MRRRASNQTQVSARTVQGISILAVSGRITLGDGNVLLREAVQQVIEEGNNKIVLNFREVGYMDSSGIGELVRTMTTVRRHGGWLRLVAPSKRVRELLEMTQLSAIFDSDPDEATAINSLAAKGPSPGLV
ncbi:MAG: STAS domain-containing protein [Acidobacteria bacterium]|nr:STAS domain-containing protein [Acidobacteriota bacterium]